MNPKSQKDFSDELVGVSRREVITLTAMGALATLTPTILFADARHRGGALETNATTPLTTSGDIAVHNFTGALRASWHDYLQVTPKPGTAEQIVGAEMMNAQFLGDLSSADRLEALANDVRECAPETDKRYLLCAQVASYLHRFKEAENDLREAERRGATPANIEPLRLSMRQATGDHYETVLETRRKRAREKPGIGELVPLAGLLVDLGEYDEADRAFAEALAGYGDVSPFPVAWVYFQRGALWGERMPVALRNSEKAQRFYERAVSHLPAYVAARVHLSELLIKKGDLNSAKNLLSHGASLGDPESLWRLSQIQRMQGDAGDATKSLDAAATAYDLLLRKHELAFADHAAEFYLSDGKDGKRALALARRNLANRQTLRAYELAHQAAIRMGDQGYATQLTADAHAKWSSTKAFTYSFLNRAKEKS